jgi:hypothetical protein
MLLMSGNLDGGGLGQLPKTNVSPLTSSQRSGATRFVPAPKPVVMRMRQPGPGTHVATCCDRSNPSSYAADGTNDDGGTERQERAPERPLPLRCDGQAAPNVDTCPFTLKERSKAESSTPPAKPVVTKMPVMTSVPCAATTAAQVC